MLTSLWDFLLLKKLHLDDFFSQIFILLFFIAYNYITFGETMILFWNEAVDGASFLQLLLHLDEKVETVDECLHKLDLERRK